MRSTATTSILEELTQTVHRLRIAESVVQRELQQVQQLTTQLNGAQEGEPIIAQAVPIVIANDTDLADEQRRETFLFLSNSRLVIGDRVRIKNPKPWQQDTGTVIGATRGGLYIRVRTPDGSEVKRIARNLQYLPNHS